MPGWQMRIKPSGSSWLYSESPKPRLTIRAKPRRPTRGIAVIGASSASRRLQKTCHNNIYERWSKTGGERGARSARTSDAIIPDLSKSNPLVHISKDDIA